MCISFRFGGARTGASLALFISVRSIGLVYGNSYYREKLSAVRLRRCYELAPPRIKQYLKGEIKFVVSNIRNSDVALELGCGYGRVMKEVASHASRITGNDTSRALRARQV